MHVYIFLCCSLTTQPPSAFTSTHHLYKGLNLKMSQLQRNSLLRAFGLIRVGFYTVDLRSLTKLNLNPRVSGLDPCRVLYCRSAFVDK